MGTAIRNKIKRLEYIRNNVKKETSKIMQNHEQEIIRLNTSQFEEGIGSDGKTLINSNKRYSGRYTYFTQQVAIYEKPIASKTEGSLYNFAWNGDFLSGMYVDFKQSGEYSVFSTGMGTGSKLSFFKGYNNMFGLNDDSKSKLRRIIEQEIKNFIKRKI